MDRELGDAIPAFNQPPDRRAGEVDITNLSALTSALGGIRTWAEIGAIALVAVLIVGGAELLLRAFEVPQYIMPPPSMIAGALVSDFHLLAPHIAAAAKQIIPASGGFASKHLRRSARLYQRVLVVPAGVWSWRVCFRLLLPAALASCRSLANARASAGTLLPPLLAISRCFSGCIAANPRFRPSSLASRAIMLHAFERSCSTPRAR